MNYHTVPNYSLILRQDSIKSGLWYSHNSGAPWYISTYVSESRFDIQNYQDIWDPASPNWSVRAKAKKVEIRKRYSINGQWLYLWESTAAQPYFRRFQIGILKGTVAADGFNSTEGFHAESAPNDEYDFIESFDLEFAQKLLAYPLGIAVKSILLTTSEEEGYSTSIAIRNYSDGRLAAFEVEKIDEKIKSELNFIFEKKTIIAVNGCFLQFKSAELFQLKSAELCIR
ncbi:MAG: hypothetical protein ACOX2F_08595 [bacterium]